MSNYRNDQYGFEPSQRQLGYGFPGHLYDPRPVYPPEWDEPDAPEPDEPDPAAVAKAEAEAAAYESACECGYALAYLAARGTIRLVPYLKRLIAEATRPGGWGETPRGVY